MGGAHAHGHDVHAETAQGPRRALLGFLAAVGAATLVGLVLLWPTSAPPTVQFAADGVTFPTAEVLSVGDPCPVITADPTAPTGEGEGFSEGCN